MRVACILSLSSHTLIEPMTDVRADRSGGDRFEFGLTLLLTIAVSLTISVLVAGIGWLIWR
jgi:hypothetical protein